MNRSRLFAATFAPINTRVRSWRSRLVYFIELFVVALCEKLIVFVDDSRRHRLTFLIVRIEGSLFFDGEHTADQIAPAYHLTTTWEVHPISKITRLVP